MAGKALRYIGKHENWIPGVEQNHMLPDREASLPVNVIEHTPEGDIEHRWTFKDLVTTGEYEWAPVDEIAALLNPPAPAEATSVAEAPVSEVPEQAKLAEAAASTADELREDQPAPRKRNA